MGWDVGIWGELRFPKGGVAKWKKLEVDASAMGGWKAPLKRPKKGAPEGVGELLARYASWPPERRQGEFFTLERGDDQARFRGFLNEDSFEEVVPIVALFRSAASVGARGALSIGGLGIGIGLRVEVEPDGSRIEEAPELEEAEEIAALAEESQRAGETKRARAAREKLEKPFLELPLEVASAREEAIARLDALDEKALLDAAARAEVGGGPTKLLHEVFRTRAAILDVLRAPQKKVDVLIASPLLGAPIHILSFVDPERAEALALRVLPTKAPDDVRAQAVLALAQSASDAALDALLAQFKSKLRHQVEARGAARRALGRSRHPEAGARVAALLTPKLLESEDLGDVLVVLGRRRHRDVLPFLAKQFKSHPAAAVRKMVAGTLLEVATDDELRQATGMARDAFFAQYAPNGWLNAPAKLVDGWVKKIIALADEGSGAAPKGAPTAARKKK